MTKQWLTGARFGTVRYRLVTGLVLARGLGGNPWQRARIVVAVLLASLRRGTRRLPLSVGGRRLTWTLGPPADFDVLNEVILHDCYQPPADLEPRVVLDLGGHIGTSVLRFRTAYPDARIVGLEADPVTYARLEANVPQLGDVKVINAAAAAKTGEAWFHQTAEAICSQVVTEGGTIRVPTFSLDDLIEKHGPVDLLKLDIEGTEDDVLRASRRLSEISVVVGEYHCTGDTQKRERFFALLDGYDLDVRGDVGNYNTMFTARR